MCSFGMRRFSVAFWDWSSEASTAGYGQRRAATKWAMSGYGEHALDPYAIGSARALENEAMQCS